MCQLSEADVESKLISVLRKNAGLAAFDIFELLQSHGICVVHFCDAVFRLAEAGRVRCKDADHILDPHLPPSQLLRLRLEIGDRPTSLHAGPKQRNFPEGFTVFLDKVLGRGGVGVVYLGEQVRLKRPVAVKILRLKNLPDGVSREWFADRFRREPRVIARMNHPHIVQVIDCGEDGEDLWYAMEFLEGGTLSDRIRRERKLPPDDVRAYMRGVAEALAEATLHGVLHRDVKPGNIFNRGIKLADFGLAKSTPLPGEEEAGGSITHARAILGTPFYLAPERASAMPGDFRSDMYSLGATVYHAATGKHLFDVPSDNRNAWYAAHMHEEPPRLETHLPGFPKDLADIIHRCLEKSPGERYDSFDELVKALK